MDVHEGFAQPYVHQALNQEVTAIKSTFINGMSEGHSGVHSLFREGRNSYGKALGETL